jgi:2-keto-3-deoxy-L-rhamnonate aldolase RhmA
MNIAKVKLEAGHSLLAGSVSIGHPAVVEIMGQAGYDCVELDREHSLISVDTMEWMLMACRAANLTPFWRMGRFDEAEMKVALDTGFTSFIIPHIRDAAEAECVARATRYAPRGRRGVGPARPIRYGLDQANTYLDNAERDLVVGLMIEEPGAVEDIENIVQVEGVHLVQVGFWDLSVGYGLGIQERHPRLVEAAERVLDAGLRAGKWVGIPPASPEDKRDWEEKGARYFEVDTATGLLCRAARETVQQYSLQPVRAEEEHVH